MVTLKIANTYLQVEKTLIFIYSIVKCVPYINCQNILGITEDQNEYFLPLGLTPTAGRTAFQGGQFGWLHIALEDPCMSCAPPAFSSSICGQYVLPWNCSQYISMLVPWIDTLSQLRLLNIATAICEDKHPSLNKKL